MYIAKRSRELRLAASRDVIHVNLKEVKGLPGPVEKYFRLVLQDGALVIHHAFVSQVGGFRAKPEMAGWSTMRAEQDFSTRPRAFVWNAKISLFPGVPIRISDSYVEGKGEMKGKLLSLFTVIDAQNQRELDEAALQRYLAEAVWFPTALLPSQGVIWTALDGQKARATLTDSGVTVSLDFEFNSRGEIVSVYTAERYREVSGEYTLTPWKGKYSRYIDVEGYLVPSEAEVEWHLGHQNYPYWKARLDQIKYE